MYGCLQTVEQASKSIVGVERISQKLVSFSGVKTDQPRHKWLRKIRPERLVRGFFPRKRRNSR